MSEKTLSLYGLSHEYVELYNALIETADEETGEVDIDISKALEQVQGAFEEKAIATATVYRAMGNYSDEIDKEIKRLQALKKHVDGEQRRIADYLTEACERTGTVSLKGVYANITFRKSEQTVIDDESILPVDYVIEKITYSPDKTKIKAAIKAGQEVQGAHIEVKNNIQIK